MCKFYRYDYYHRKWAFVIKTGLIEIFMRQNYCKRRAGKKFLISILLSKDWRRCYPENFKPHTRLYKHRFEGEIYFSSFIRKNRTFCVRL